MLSSVSKPPPVQETAFLTKPAPKDLFSDERGLSRVSALAANPEGGWQVELARAFSNPRDLLTFLNLDPGQADESVSAQTSFSMRVPRPFANRMVKGDPNDPLLRQVLPVKDESTSFDGFLQDPLAEQSGPLPGMLHKYRSRVLLILRGGCAVNCRYCFRRHFPYGEHGLGRDEMAKIVDYIGKRPEINEVILSGGDPLVAKDQQISDVFASLATLPQLRRVRIHTRLPVVIPSRVTPTLVRLLGEAPWPTIVVLHTNHPQEIDDALAGATRDLREAGVTLLNQAVLLAGVNDTVETLSSLSERLFDIHVLPYYLHLLDKVEGAAHFDVSDAVARTLMAGLLERLPGFLVPRLVREVGGDRSKRPIDLNLPQRSFPGAQ